MELNHAEPPVLNQSQKPLVQGMDLDSLVLWHNQVLKGDEEKDVLLSRLLLGHKLLKDAIKEVGNGVVVEIGCYEGITLDQLARHPELSKALIIGLDKGDYVEGPIPDNFWGFWDIPSAAFYAKNLQALSEAQRGRLVLDQKKLLVPHLLVYRHDLHPLTFALYGATEQAILQNSILDLVLLKCMFGYLGGTQDESLEHFKRSILTLGAERLVILDYIGECQYRKVQIPKPGVIAETIASAYPSAHISVQEGKNHFLLYAKR